MPGLHGASAITGARAGFYCGEADADMTFSVYCNVVGAWTEASSYTTLEALSFGSATATSQLADTATSYEEYDILGSAGSNGIANAYNGTDTPNNVTVKLFKDLSVTQAYKENFFLLGTYSTDYVTFHDNDDANPPYIEIDYTGYDVSYNNATSGFYVQYERNVGEADFNDTGFPAHTASYTLLTGCPDLTGKVIEEAWLQVYCSGAHGMGFAATQVYINDTNTTPWNESSAYSVLSGLSMGSASANTIAVTTASTYSWADVTDVVTALYAADKTPETITIKLKQTEFTTTNTYAETPGLYTYLGDSSQSYHEDYASIAGRQTARYMRLYIWYSDAAGASGQVGIGATFGP